MKRRAKRPKRLTAHVAPFKTAISEARRAGFTWGEIASALGVEGEHAGDRVRWAVRECRYEVPQAPLPDPEDLGAPAPAARPAAPASADGLPPEPASDATSCQVASGGASPVPAPAAAAAPAVAADGKDSTPTPAPGKRVSAREALAAARQYNYPTRTRK